MVMPCESGAASHDVHMESIGFKRGEEVKKLTIDGKALYVHRANYVIMDTDAL